MFKIAGRIYLEYGISLFAVAGAIVARWLIDPWLGDNLPFVTVFGAIAIAVWFGGYRPALLASLVSLLACDYLFIEPRGSLNVSGVGDVIGMLAFFLSCSIIIAFGEALRVARRRAEESRKDAEDKKAQIEQEAKKRLEAQYAQFRLGAIVQNSDDAIIGKNLDGIVTSWNQGAERLYGYSASEMIGKSISLLTPPEKADELSSIMDRVREGKRIEPYDTVRRCKDGQCIDVSLSISPVIDDDDQIIGASVIARDISERRRFDRRRNARLAVTQLLAEAAKIEECIPRILAVICESLEWDVGTFWAVDAAKQAIRCQEIWHRTGMPISEFEVATRKLALGANGSLPGRVWTSRQPVWIPNVVADSGFVRTEVAAKAGLHGAFACPVNVGTDVLGVIEFFSHEIRKPDDDLLEMVTTVGGQIGQFIARKRFEQESQRIAEQLQIVTDGMAAPITRCSRDLRFLWVSKPYADWIGRPPEEIINHPIVEIMGDAAFRQLQPHFEQVLSGQRVKYEEEVDYQGMGRRWLNATYTPTFDANGSADGWIAVVLDVTERKRMEQALRTSEQRFSRFMQHLPGLAWIKDSHGQYIYANDAAVEAFRCSRSEIYGKTDQEIFPAEIAAQFAENDRRARASRTGVQVIESLEHEDGVTHYSIVSKFPILGASDEPVMVGGMAIDITDRMNAEAALKESDRRKDEFLATLAHELRNPLAPIRNALELMKGADIDRNDFEETRSVMDRQLGQMVRLIDDLLDISRITTGKLQVRKERIELATVMQSAVEASQYLIEAEGHELTVTLPPQPIHLDADPTRLTQVIANLLNNAAKYTEKGGHIWLIAQREKGEVVISVRDTGIGISAEHLPNVFQMFSQATPALDRAHGGLGIGLSLVRGLVELHNGTVEAHSAGAGRGSEFVVRLPIVEVQTEVLLPHSGEKGCSARACRILVVDDNRDAASTLAILLKKRGHSIQKVFDGLEAIQAAASFRPDVVLLDIGLPKMNGYEVARHIREQPWGGKLTLVAVTGWGQEEDKRQALDAGFNHHLTKPVAVQAVEKILAEVVPVELS